MKQYKPTIDSGCQLL